jgi:hypothetical protein
MTEIKKRSGWVITQQPHAPRGQPIKPKKERVKRKFVSLWSTTATEFPLDELLSNLPGAVSEGIEVQVYFTSDGEDYSTSIGRYEDEVVINKNFEKRLKKWEVVNEKWKAENLSYVEELKEWKLWVKQENELALKKQLDAAEALLKKHGKVVVTPK